MWFLLEEVLMKVPEWRNVSERDLDGSSHHNEILALIVIADPAGSS